MELESISKNSHAKITAISIANVSTVAAPKMLVWKDGDVMNKANPPTRNR